jgi:hypothetical protein
MRLGIKAGQQIYREITQKREKVMSDTIVVKTKTCTVCGEYEVWSLDRQAVTKWQEGEYIQNAFPNMSAEDRELLISGTHPACWNKLFGEDDNE